MIAVPVTSSEGKPPLPTHAPLAAGAGGLCGGIGGSFRRGSLTLRSGFGAGRVSGGLGRLGAGGGAAAGTGGLCGGIGGSFRSFGSRCRLGFGLGSLLSGTFFDLFGLAGTSAPTGRGLFGLFCGGLLGDGF